MKRKWIIFKAALGFMIFMNIVLFIFDFKCIRNVQMNVQRNIQSGEIADMKTENHQQSIERLLFLAKEPLGKTMYVWGGGWNEEDSGAGVETVTLGVSPAWERFAKKQDAAYDFNQTRYQIHNGLDCSGYIGWLIYNFLETENGKEGYVVKSSEMASFLAKKGLGEYTESTQVQDWKPGDIMSMKGHVWMSLGSCEDGSVVVLHASPPGVTLSGTLLPDGSESMALQLAKKYMKENYPKWYKKYGVKACGYKYLTASSQMRWNEEWVKDAQGLQEKSAKEVLEMLFEKN